MIDVQKLQKLLKLAGEATPGKRHVGQFNEYTLLGEDDRFDGDELVIAEFHGPGKRGLNTHTNREHSTPTSRQMKANVELAAALPPEVIKALCEVVPVAQKALLVLEHFDGEEAVAPITMQELRAALSPFSPGASLKG